MFADLVVWKKAVRPTFEQLRVYVEGYMSGLGSITVIGEKIVVSLPGTPSVLFYDSKVFEQDIGGVTAREIEIVYKGSDGLLVQRQVQDSLTRAVAAGLSSMFYGLQGFEDEAKERSEAAS